MTKIVISECHGGFGLSAKATEAYLARQGKKVYWFEPSREGGKISLDEKVSSENPDAAFLRYSYTSPEATEESWFSCRDIKRDDPDLVAVVEEMGDAASGRHANLKVVEIPDDVPWTIEEYDGLEWVAEEHRTWGSS